MADEPLKKRTDFPMTGAGTRQWKAYQKEHGLGEYAGGPQVKPGLKKADETVEEGPGGSSGNASDPRWRVRRPGETEAQRQARVAARRAAARKVREPE